MTEDKRAKILAKVQLLLNKAESTTYGPEQDSLLAKVDALMTEYAIADWEVSQTAEAKSEPVLHVFECSEANNDLWYDLVMLAQHCGTFFDCKSVFAGLHGKGKWSVDAKLVGFPENVRNAEFMFHSLRLQMAMTLAPKYDPGEVLEENVRRFKEAGMKWEDIWALLHKGGVPLCTDPIMNRSRIIKIQRDYGEYCTANGFEAVKTSPKNYKLNFSNAFVSTIGNRMYEIKAAARRARREADTATSTSTELVLVDRTKEVAAAFDVYFPRVGRGVGRSGVKHNSAASGAGRAAGSNADLGSSSNRMQGSRKALQ